MRSAAAMTACPFISIILGRNRTAQPVRGLPKQALRFFHRTVRLEVRAGSRQGADKIEYKTTQLETSDQNASPPAAEHSRKGSLARANLLPTDGKRQIRSSQDAEPETLLGNASPVGCRQILVLS